MANPYMRQFFYSKIPMLSGIMGQINVASSTTGVTSENILGASAARTGVGEITITLDETWNACMGVHVMIESATAQDRVAQVASVDVTSAKTIVVRLLAGATATDPASALTMHVLILLKNSSVTY